MATTQAAAATPAAISSATEDFSKIIFDYWFTFCKNYKTNSERLAENLTSKKKKKKELK